MYAIPWCFDEKILYPLYTGRNDDNQVFLGNENNSLSSLATYPEKVQWWGTCKSSLTTFISM